MEATWNMPVDQRLYEVVKLSYEKWFTGSHQIHTPRALVEEILVQIPELSNNKNVLVLFNLEFVISLAYTSGVNTSNITFYSDHENKTKLARRIGVNVIETLENINMKFDVVVGNPPYQNSSHKAKKNSMWKEFLDMATKISPTVAFVIPSSFTAPAPTFNKYKKHISKISFDVKKHFSGIGSSFCYVLIHNEIQPECSVITKDETFVINLQEIDCLPETISTKLISESEKVFLNNRQWHRTCEYHTQAFTAFEENGDIEVIHGTAIKHTKVNHENNSKIRVYCPTTTYPVFKICQDKGLSQNQVWTECSTIQEAQVLCNYLNSENVQTILRNYKWSNMYYPQTISKLGMSDD